VIEPPSNPTLDVTADAGFVIPYSGLWDFAPGDTEYHRIPHERTLDIISRYSARLNSNHRRTSLSRAAYA